MQIKFNNANLASLAVGDRLPGLSVDLGVGASLSSLPGGESAALTLAGEVLAAARLKKAL